jgi:hypothetical protein
MASRIRDALYRAITGPRGDAIGALRVSKGLARQVNASLGFPLATRDEIAARVAARAELEELRTSGAKPTRSAAPPAPVFVYFEAGRNVRELNRIEELLGAKGIPWTRLDVRDDEATLEFVTRKAGCEPDDLPVVFVAEHAVGRYPDVVRADVAGDLERLVFGAGGV